jgi:hypothetical protein
LEEAYDSFISLHNQQFFPLASNAYQLVACFAIKHLYDVGVEEHFVETKWAIHVCF